MLSFVTESGFWTGSDPSCEGTVSLARIIGTAVPIRSVGVHLPKTARICMASQQSDSLKLAEGEETSMAARVTEGGGMDVGIMTERSTGGPEIDESSKVDRCHEDDKDTVIVEDSLQATDTRDASVVAATAGKEEEDVDMGNSSSLLDTPEHTKESATSEKPSTHDSPERKKMRKNNKGGKVRPNAFVSVRVPSWHVRRRLQEVQEAMVEAEPCLQSSLVSLDKLHVTMMVLKLKDDEDIERARQVLSETTERIKQDRSFVPLKLEFSGIDHFNNKVVFIKIKDGPEKDRLCEIADRVRTSFSDAKLPTTDDRPFQSHLTVAKISSASREHRITLQSKIPHHSYSEFLQHDFGEECIEGLELLSMTEPVDFEGYYHCFHKCSFAHKK